jgi:hypothetical protein
MGKKKMEKTKHRKKIPSKGLGAHRSLGPDRSLIPPQRSSLKPLAPSEILGPLRRARLPPGPDLGMGKRGSFPGPHKRGASTSEGPLCKGGSQQGVPRQKGFNTMGTCFDERQKCYFLRTYSIDSLNPQINS